MNNPLGLLFNWETEMDLFRSFFFRVNTCWSPWRTWRNRGRRTPRSGGRRGRSGFAAASCCWPEWKWRRGPSAPALGSARAARKSCRCSAWPSTGPAPARRRRARWPPAARWRRWRRCRSRASGKCNSTARWSCWPARNRWRPVCRTCPSGPNWSPQTHQHQHYSLLNVMDTCWARKFPNITAK